LGAWNDSEAKAILGVQAKAWMQQKKGQRNQRRPNGRFHIVLLRVLGNGQKKKGSLSRLPW